MSDNHCRPERPSKCAPAETSFDLDLAAKLQADIFGTANDCWGAARPKCGDKTTVSASVGAHIDIDVVNGQGKRPPYRPAHPKPACNPPELPPAPKPDCGSNRPEYVPAKPGCNSEPGHPGWRPMPMPRPEIGCHYPMPRPVPQRPDYSMNFFFNANIGFDGGSVSWNNPLGYGNMSWQRPETGCFSIPKPGFANVDVTVKPWRPPVRRPHC